MIDARSTLTDVCFAVSAALKDRGIRAVLTGGSAAAVYAPEVYMSHDADFIVDVGDLNAIDEALTSIGFFRNRRSRIFAHPQSAFTVNFPRGPLAVGGEYVRDSNVINRGEMELRILTPFDCVRDRLAHFYHWNDYTALKAAIGVAASHTSEIDFARLRAWTIHESSDLLPKFEEFKRRLRETEP
jgi:hypothetical protein